MPKAASSLKAFRAKSALTKRQENDSRHHMMVRAVKISNKISDFAEANPTDEDYQDKEMSMAQLKAAEIILNRTVPVLSAIQIVSDDDNENLTREEIETRIRDKLAANPLLGILAGITPKTIEGEAHDITEESDGDS